MRDLVTAVIQGSNTQDMLQVFAVVIAVVALFPLARTEAIALLPHANGMRLDVGQVFDIGYGKTVHGCNKKRDLPTNIVSGPQMAVKETQILGRRHFGMPIIMVFLA